MTSDLLITTNPANAAFQMPAVRPPADPRPALRAMTQEEIVALLKDNGQQAFRGKQVYHWIQKKGAVDFDEMGNIPKDLKAWLSENTRFGGMEALATTRESADGSVKFLFRLRGGLHIESVLMPGVTHDPLNMTLCVSSQVGCAVDCKFCVTGANGFFRNMSADEILDQALTARRFLAEKDDGRRLRNIVFMGMGEPLLNPDNVIRAIRLMTDSDGMDLSARRITVSTSGILPGLEALAQADTGVGLAISLNGVTQAEREAVMPITRRYPLSDLLAALKRYPLRNRGRITFEYVLLKGVNDSIKHAHQMAKLLHGIPSKVNVIPFNPDPALPFERPDREDVEEFATAVATHNLTVSVRWSKALDVDGACGQLAGQYAMKDAKGTRMVIPRYAEAAPVGEG
ncbi:MAG: 23S rRNA (adenine(2503)-C(2))-methyltransferase RlmN [Sumerlaeia bacterium]